MTEAGQTGQQQNRQTGPLGGWTPSRGLIAAVLGITTAAGVIAGAVIFGSGGSGDARYVYEVPTVAAMTTEPAIIATQAPPSDSAGHRTPSDSPASTERPTATSTSTPRPIASSVSASPTIGDAWTATPSVSTPAPSIDLTPAAAALAAEIEARWGIDVVTTGQDWGITEDMQLRNLGALYGALAALPVAVVAAATHNAHGTLALLSNNSGRTLAGWQPYGSGAANFYSSEDWSATDRYDASQVVLQTGADGMTIAHELLHAYQMREVASGAYAQSLLTPEMQSFMAGSGWLPTVPPDELAQRLNGSWDEVGSLFQYTGTDLTYVSNTGETVHAYTPNPVEAFAVVGALYYAAPDGTDLPDWPEYWAWFAANLG
ncbi:MAG: hypothetical protein WD904_13360 [Dehalococcoidia bacterium]